jgi:mRNA interferase HicA
VRRQAFIRELERAGCEFVRHGRRHDVYRNPVTGRQAPVPRHREVADTLCEVIRKQLGLNAGETEPDPADA